MVTRMYQNTLSERKVQNTFRSKIQNTQNNQTPKTQNQHTFKLEYAYNQNVSKRISKTQTETQTQKAEF